MTTFAEHDAVIAKGLDPILRRWGLEYEDQLIEELTAFVIGHRARAIEESARSPESQRGPGRKTAATRRRSA